MKQFNFFDGSIIACSSGATQNSAISIIRLSGFADFNVFSPFFDIDFEKLKPRHAYLSDLVYRGKIIDSIMVTAFVAPHSYNGENILELSVHGNVLNIERIIKIFVDELGFRMAQPGEFTFRALKNQKMSLSQVEGLDLLLNSTSNEVYEQGLSLLNGELNRSYLSLQKQFVKLKSSVELFFDFLEDVGEENARRNFDAALRDFTHLITSLYKRSTSYKSNLLSPDLVLIGPPNAGKSSLFNDLVGHDRAIVSPIAGTTRDTISEYIQISGVHFKIIDTAGIREHSNDVIENEGIRRSLKTYGDSFFKILVLNPLEVVPESVFEFSPDVVVLTHADQPDFQQKSLNLRARFSRIPVLNQVYGKIGSIEPRLFPLISCKFNNLSSVQPLYIERHRDVINDLYLLINKFNVLTKNEADFAIISSELNTIGQSLAELIGIVSPEQVLQNIFSSFCIGK